jgi:3-hydroxyacyl-[acyl-carrier-protein] dehydratase
VKAAYTLHFPADHPAFAGHFPGMPILPGALLLDEALTVVVCDLGLDLREWQVTAAKFFEPVRPGDVLAVEHSGTADKIAFAVHSADRPVLSGTLSRLTAGADDDA